MKIATFNINGINGRLPALLQLAGEGIPDIVCLQELKAPDEALPQLAIRSAGYGAIWHGQRSWNGVAILQKGGEPVETDAACPAIRTMSHSRYIEAAIDGVIVGCLYLPNGNPQPGPKFDYKLAWFERFNRARADTAQVAPAGDPGRRLQRGADRFRHLQPEVVAQGALLQPADQGCLSATARPGLDRRAPRPASRGAHLYVLGLLPRSLGAQCGVADRSPAAERGARSAPGRRQRGPWVRGEPKPSDHAPTWVLLSDMLDA